MTGEPRERDSIVADVSPSGFLADRRALLLGQLRDDWEPAPAEVRTFAARLLVADAADADPGPADSGGSAAARQRARDLLAAIPGESALAYGGAPEVAAAGYRLGARLPGADAVALGQRFRDGVGRLRARPRDPGPLLGNQLLLLGLADGVAVARLTDGLLTPGTDAWLVELLGARPPLDTAMQRVRDLALDLLDGRGRVRANLDAADPYAVAIELALRGAWPTTFAGTAPPAADARELALAQLLFGEPPTPGDLARAAVAWCALDALTRASVAAIAPRVETVVEVLRATQTALRRWVWELKPRTKNAPLAQWRLDNEYHIQSVLWMVLYPLFGDALRDEEYLQGCGLTQPRADLAITTLRAIIEVKFARSPADFAVIEEEVAGDLGLYFVNAALFDHMVVYVYDDADDHRPEEYDRLRNALRTRDSRIREVVIVRRPGKLPPRATRLTRRRAKADESAG